METSPELAIRRYALPFRSPLRTARGAWTVREGILIRVTGADGRLGYGEIAPIQGFGGRPLDDCAAELERLGRFPAREALVTQAKVLPGLRGALVEAGIDSVSTASRMREYVAVAALLPAGRAALPVLRDRLELEIGKHTSELQSQR